MSVVTTDTFFSFQWRLASLFFRKTTTGKKRQQRKDPRKAKHSLEKVSSERPQVHAADLESYLKGSTILLSLERDCRGLVCPKAVLYIKLNLACYSPQNKNVTIESVGICCCCN